MTEVKRLVLDVLKPHQPDTLELARAIAACGTGLRVNIGVEEMDEQTESVLVTIEGDDIDLQRVRAAIEELGGSLHSIDEVEVLGPVGSD
ncbi:MAG: hypothetical protein AMJ69_09535 [Gammaproteobacteria bacterium SG8_47]|nr:MAG: hypothetical protein AMJ69_09535 [Gammaproteobacteria bacterium SG8_47]